MKSKLVRTLALPAMVATAFAAVSCDGGDSGTDPDPQPQLGSISGTATADGAGVAGATIALTGAATASAQTNSSGQFTFDNLAAGSYTVTITPPTDFELDAGQQASQSVTLGEGDDESVTWALRSTGGGGDDIVEITASGTSFSPQTVTVDVGQTVRWTVTGGSHTVTPDDANQAGVWTGSELLSEDDTFEWVVPESAAGQAIDYHCNPHQAAGMVGTITVN